ncbi:Biosynthetic Aromatic amino acid aminotransferase alpha / Aspartate aminotransferase [Thermococcus sp. 2319x1]|uniref:pyridoxal phosphate-dependent aminotransferase n=1 Tax=Thermococcus sp. 2319x1 TaxID=1674923 RepID=UPI00073AC4C5|nr:aminotransferase class I/II-fold pyridoxal phosphate-dependent enzyme [Thermococcus sp. 2319x1]ALV62721.1 Biosynthetic Aromatic amino acid aminotransferase alpha / Aspartate aminotransferase [Thermococcus sp. 2319x1]
MFNVYEFFNRINEVKPESRLDVGQPDIPVRVEIIEETIESLRRGETGYTNTGGIRELREKIAEVEGVSADKVIIAPGAKILIAAEIASARRVAVVSPHWNAYSLIAHQFGKEVEVIRTTIEEKWTPGVEDIKADLLIINYPNNPTGRVLSAKELRGILEAAEEKGVKVLSDEVYAELSFTRFTPARELCENVVTVKSFSKLYSMTGFRLGYAIGERDEIRRIQRFIESTVTCVPPFVQKAGIKALELREELSREVRKIYLERARMASKVLGGFDFVEPEGAFYIFLRTPQDGMAFAERLLSKGVAVFPGIAFGDYPNFIRISLSGRGLERGLRIIREELECALESRATEGWEGSSRGVSVEGSR